MARTDLVADMLTMIRNAVMAKKETLVIPASKLNSSILTILKNIGYIENFRSQAAVGTLQTIKVYLKYGINKKPAIKGIKRVSRPGLRVYYKYTKMPSVIKGFGHAIVSTSKGLLTDREAREQKIGGEILCYVW